MSDRSIIHSVTATELDIQPHDVVFRTGPNAWLSDWVMSHGRLGPDQTFANATRRLERENFRWQGRAKCQLARQNRVDYLDIPGVLALHAAGAEAIDTAEALLDEWEGTWDELVEAAVRLTERD